MSSVEQLPFEKVPDYAGVLEGWRIWIVKRHRIRHYDPETGARKRIAGPYLLRSVMSSDLWRPGQTMVADCNRTPGYRFDLTHRDADLSSPDSACKCGIYAVRSLDKILVVYDAPNRFFYRLSVERYAAVIGRVKLWGKVVPGQWGWRAQYAYPSELYIVQTLMGKLFGRHEEVKDDLMHYKVPVGFMTPKEILSYTPLARATSPGEQPS